MFSSNRILFSIHANKFYLFISLLTIFFFLLFFRFSWKHNYINLNITMRIAWIQLNEKYKKSSIQLRKCRRKVVKWCSINQLIGATCCRLFFCIMMKMKRISRKLQIENNMQNAILEIDRPNGCYWIWKI